MPDSPLFSRPTREERVPHWSEDDVLTPLFADSLVARHRASVRQLYRDLTHRRPLYRDATGSWVVSSHETACAVLSDPRFRAQPTLPAEQARAYAPILRMMLLRDGEDHAVLRRHFAPLFKTRHMENVHAFVEADVTRALAALPRHGPFDAIATLARRLPARMACVLLGLRPDYAERLTALTAPLVRLLSGSPLPPDAVQALLRSSAAAIDELARLARGEARAENLPEGTVPPARDESAPALSEAEYASNLSLLFVAGYVTSMLSIGNVLSLALGTPGVWQRFVDQPATIPAAVAELSRLEPAAHVLQRFASENVAMAGTTVRAGDTVVILVAAANRDPRVFAAPDNIDFQRAGARPLTYGAGPHGCMGVALARKQLGAVLAALARRYPRLTLLEQRARGLQIGTFLGYDELWAGT